MTSTVTRDFRHEFEQEAARWLRVRFRWYCLVIGALNAVLLLGGVTLVLYGGEEAPRLSTILIDGAQVAIFIAPLLWLRTRERTPERDTLVRIVVWMIILNGLAQLVPTGIRAVQANGVAPAIGPGGAWMLAVFLSHLVASLFIPWTPREAIKPLVPLLGLNAIGALWADPPLQAVIVIAISPLIGVPGVFIAWWRGGRFKERFHLNALRGRYGEIKRELTDARRIHEALFPPPVQIGPVRFDYRYEPMRQIGGDFLFAHPGANPTPVSGETPLSVVLIDVTGHGVPAALTVNRLHGEMERLFAEEPDIGPGEVLTALNRYVHLTLANHSVYATALCVQIDPEAAELRYASGGHPPAFLRTVDGRLDRLDSTSFVLGACHGEDFDPGERPMRFAQGDTLVLYTDGATEARNEEGRMLGVEGFQALMATVEPRAVAEGGWAGALLAAVERFRFGPAADDTLVVEIYRPLESARGDAPDAAEARLPASAPA